MAKVCEGHGRRLIGEMDKIWDMYRKNKQKSWTWWRQKWITEVLQKWVAKGSDNFFKRIAKQQKIPTDWKLGKINLIFKKRRKNVTMKLSRNLLNSRLKVFTKLLLQEIWKTVNLREVQQGFQGNPSTINAIFVVKEIIEKSKESNKPVYLCFVDMTKAFDRVHLTDITKIMKGKRLNQRLVQLISDVNKQYKTNRVEQALVKT